MRVLHTRGQDSTFNAQHRPRQTRRNVDKTTVRARRKAKIWLGVTCTFELFTTCHQRHERKRTDTATMACFGEQPLVLAHYPRSAVQCRLPFPKDHEGTRKTGTILPEARTTVSESVNFVIPDRHHATKKTPYAYHASRTNACVSYCICRKPPNCGAYVLIFHPAQIRSGRPIQLTTPLPLTTCRSLPLAKTRDSLCRSRNHRKSYLTRVSSFKARTQPKQAIRHTPQRTSATTKRLIPKRGPRTGSLRTYIRKAVNHEIECRTLKQFALCIGSTIALLTPSSRLRESPLHVSRKKMMPRRRLTTAGIKGSSAAERQDCARSSAQIIPPSTARRTTRPNELPPVLGPRLRLTVGCLADRWIEPPMSRKPSTKHNSCNDADPETERCRRPLHPKRPFSHRKIIFTNPPPTTPRRFSGLRTRRSKTTQI